MKKLSRDVPAAEHEKMQAYMDGYRAGAKSILKMIEELSAMGLSVSIEDLAKSDVEE